jgi:hypothetical protein
MVTALSELERKDLARRHLDAAETWLRRIIHNLMLPHFGDAYLTPGERGSCPHISNQIRRDISARYEAAKDRFPRTVDAADMGHAIKIVLHPELYPKIFRPAFVRAFPDGADETRTFLVRLEDIRNKLAHGGTCSDRDLERCVCYSNDMIDSLKAYFKEMNVEQQFNVPTFIRVVDNKGHDIHFGTDRGPHLFADFSKQETGTIRFGDELIIEVELDPTFTDYDVDWHTFKGDSGVGPVCRLQLGHRHVGNNLDIRFQVKSKQPWHRLGGGMDDMLDVRYRVLPPL